MDPSENVRQHAMTSVILLHIKTGRATMTNMALSLAEEDNGNGPIEVSKTTYTYIASPVSH